MDFKGHIIDQKGFIKRYKKRATSRVFGPNIPVFSGIFLSEIGGSP